MSRRRAPRFNDFENSRSYSSPLWPSEWEYPNLEPGVKHNNKQCQSCKFRNILKEGETISARICCHYFLITGKRRGCSASPHCTKYVEGEPFEKRRVFNPHHPKGFSNTDDPPYVRLKNFSK